MRNQIRAWILAIALCLPAGVSGAADWVADGSYLNAGDIASMSWALNPSMVVIQGVPYVAWEEELIRGNSPSQVIVKRWNGGTWLYVGNHLNIDPTRPAKYPSLTQMSSLPYVAWSESNGTKSQIYVAHWDGNAWVRDGGSLNVDVNQSAIAPSCSAINGRIYVAWSESIGATNRIYVKHLEYSNWVQDGGTLNNNPNQDAIRPSLDKNNGNPCVAWEENGLILVKYWNGANWVQLPSAMPGLYPALANQRGTPFIAYQENWVANSKIHGKRFNGTDWESIGNTLNLTANPAVFQPALAFCGATPYVAWIEDLKVNVSHFNGNAWESDGVNLDQTTWDDVAPCLAFGGSTLYAAWVRQGPASLILVKHCVTNSIPDETPEPTFISVLLDEMGRKCLAFPNPGKEQVSFAVATQPGESLVVQIYNLAGEQVATLKETAGGVSQTIRWDCKSVAAGIYLARIRSNGKEIGRLKVAVQSK